MNRPWPPYLLAAARAQRCVDAAPALPVGAGRSPDVAVASTGHRHLVRVSPRPAKSGAGEQRTTVTNLAVRVTTSS